MDTTARTEPPELRIIRRRTIDVDADAAELVAEANNPRPRRRTFPAFVGLALIAIFAVALVALF